MMSGISVNSNHLETRNFTRLLETLDGDTHVRAVTEDMDALNLTYWTCSGFQVSVESAVGFVADDKLILSLSYSASAHWTESGETLSLRPYASVVTCPVFGECLCR